MKDADIVERLRNRSPYLRGSSAESVMDEAASEIYRLRTVLQNIANANIGTRVKPGETTDAANIRAIRDIAREAV